MSLRSSRDLLTLLQSGQRMLADGAVGSELIKSGIEPAQTVAANIRNPETVRQLHRRAIAAGADLITANTFGVPNGSDWEAAFLIGLKIAQATAQEAQSEVSVLFSVYPTELLLRPDIVLSTLHGSEGAALLLIETAVSIEEACAAVRTALSETVAVIAATCHFQPNGCMPDGTSPASAARALAEAGAAIVGANCGAAPEAMIPIAEQMRAATGLPLLFQPNAGLPERHEDGWVYPIDPERFAACAAQLYLVGVSVVGGCCGTTPAHIAAVRRLLFPQCRE